MARTIAIACQKGGTGKTTTTMTLGAALGAEKGKRVLLVDLDPQSSLSISAQVDVLDLKRSVYDLLQAATRRPGAVGELLEAAVAHTGLKNVDVIPATLELANAELELTSVLEREKVLKSVLAPLRRSYDFILLDCPPSLGILTVNALVAADRGPGAHGSGFPGAARGAAVHGDNPAADTRGTEQEAAARLHPDHEDGPPHLARSGG